MNEDERANAGGDGSCDGAKEPLADATTVRRRAPAWRTNVALFLVTTLSVLITGVVNDEAPPRSRTALEHGAAFTAALLAILLAHEFGHYIAARLHKVEASLPYFIPMPVLSPFGTMGAVIRMRGVIPTRKALLDIGASGPLAGLVLAIPMYFWGYAHSRIVPADGAQEGVQFGESVLLRLLERAGGLTVPDGMNVELSPVAFAAWAGMFVTMINLLPVGQLDGGHVAYALLGKRQDRLALMVHRSMLAFFFVSLFGYLRRDVGAGFGLYRIGSHVNNAIFWLVWFEMLAVLGVVSSRTKGKKAPLLSIRTRVVATMALALVAGVGRTHPAPTLWIAWFIGLALLLAMEKRHGVLRDHALFDHPPPGETAETDPDKIVRAANRRGEDRLGWPRVVIAVVTLAFFVLLFMPTPIAM